MSDEVFEVITCPACGGPKTWDDGDPPCSECHGNGRLRLVSHKLREVTADDLRRIRANVEARQ